MKQFRHMSAAIVVSAVLLLAATIARASDRPADDVAASRAAADAGWKQFNAGDLAAAETSFHEAAALDAKNGDAEWGLGLVSGNKAREAGPSEPEETEKYLKESIRHLETARTELPPNARLVTDLAYSYTMSAAVRTHGTSGDDDEFDKARALYKRAESMDKPTGQLYANWAALELYAGRPEEAQKIWAKAKALGASDDRFEKALEGEE